eukprot:scaffold990_cov393-Prasinococcus_capsulatus_cf.AAC.45
MGLAFVLDPVLVIYCGLGVRGSAYTGALSALTEASLNMLELRRKHRLAPLLGPPQWSQVLALLGISTPSTVSALTYFMVIFIVGRVLSGLGPEHVVAMGVGQRVEAPVRTICVAYMVATATRVGQRWGGSGVQDARRASAKKRAPQDEGDHPQGGSGRAVGRTVATVKEAAYQVSCITIASFLVMGPGASLVGTFFQLDPESSQSLTDFLYISGASWPFFGRPDSFHRHWSHVYPNDDLSGFESCLGISHISSATLRELSSGSGRMGSSVAQVVRALAQFANGGRSSSDWGGMNHVTRPITRRPSGDTNKNT